ncbi:hypothetical protein BI362_00875 [Streptococcus parauberis]|nr:hypothetical protein BI362_00875 [Streptococcus parauberis]QBX27682.1 hypothetical protein Javan406_0032 [Streptococcus phage Javan406]
MRPKKYPYQKRNISLFGYRKLLQSIANTKEGVFIDNMRLNYVEEEGVSVQDLGGGLHRVTIDLITDDYRTK